MLRRGLCRFIDSPRGAGELWRPVRATGLRWLHDDAPKPVRVYRRQRAEHWRTFQWGIGSRFRMQSKNRFTPVHAPHPMHSVVRDDYYDSENPSVAARSSLKAMRARRPEVWNELREGWEVFWYAPGHVEYVQKLVRRTRS